MMVELVDAWRELEHRSTSRSSMRWSAVRPLLEIIGAKLLALTIGLFFCGVGLWFMRFGGAITSALSKDYARMPPAS